MADCSEIRPNLKAFVDRELEPALRDAVRTHLAECRACSREVEEITKLGLSLAQLDDIEPSPELKNRILASLPPPRRGLRLVDTLFGQGRWFGSLGAVAGVLALVAFYRLNPGLHNKTETMVSDAEVSGALSVPLGEGGEKRDPSPGYSDATNRTSSTPAGTAPSSERPVPAVEGRQGGAKSPHSVSPAEPELPSAKKEASELKEKRPAGNRIPVTAPQLERTAASAPASFAPGATPAAAAKDKFEGNRNASAETPARPSVQNQPLAEENTKALRAAPPGPAVRGVPQQPAASTQLGSVGSAANTRAANTQEQPAAPPAGAGGLGGGGLGGGGFGGSTLQSPVQLRFIVQNRESGVETVRKVSAEVGASATAGPAGSNSIVFTLEMHAGDLAQLKERLAQAGELETFTTLQNSAPHPGDPKTLSRQRTNDSLPNTQNSAQNRPLSAKQRGKKEDPAPRRDAVQQGAVGRFQAETRQENPAVGGGGRKASETQDRSGSAPKPDSLRVTVQIYVLAKDEMAKRKAQPAPKP